MAKAYDDLAKTVDEAKAPPQSAPWVPVKHWNLGQIEEINDMFDAVGLAIQHSQSEAYHTDRSQECPATLFKCR